MRRALITGIASLFIVALVAPTAQAAAAQAGKKNPKLKVVKAFGSAGAAADIASATATCPEKTGRPDLGPWRAISGGFQMMGVVPPYTMNGPPPPPSGSGVVFESRKVGQRSWRASAQSLSGTFTLKVSVYCQNEVPKTKQDTALTAAATTPQVGPTAVARCSSGKTVSGGFSTAPPFTSASGAANTVIASMPSGKKGWEAQVISSRSSYAGITSVTSYVYCAKRKPVRVVHSFGSGGIATLDSTVADANTYSPSCPAPDGKFYPGGGGFSEEGMTTSQYLIPVSSFQQGANNWHAQALKVGSGVPVTLVAHTVCG
jgi:hypothetical protein